MDEFLDITVDYGEIVLDTFLDEGVLKEVPLIGTAIRLAQVSKAVRDRLFLRKVHDFISQLENIPEEKRMVFAKKMEDREVAKKVGEATLFAIEKANAFDKAIMIGKVFRAFILGKIDVETSRIDYAFRVMLNAIETSFISDLSQFSHWVAKGTQAGKFNIVGISISGLIETHFVSRHHLSNDVLHVPTDVGIAFSKIMLEHDTELLQAIHQFTMENSWYDTHNRPVGGTAIQSLNFP